MAKTWGQLTPEEKIEELRRDMLRIYEAVNSLASDVGKISQRVSQLSEEKEKHSSNP